MPVFPSQRVRSSKERPSVLGQATSGEPDANAPVYAYEIEGNDLKGHGKVLLPADSNLVIVSRKRYPRSKFGNFKIKREVVGLWKKQGTPPTAEVSSEAFLPDAKARALLRGIGLIEEDLRSSGGAYTLAEVQRLMRGISRQAVNNRVRDGSILAVPGPSNRASYPVVQFLKDGMPVDGLKEVRQALKTESSWILLNFLVNDEPKLDGRKPIDLLKAGELEPVVELARRVGVQGA